VARFLNMWHLEVKITSLLFDIKITTKSPHFLFLSPSLPFLLRFSFESVIHFRKSRRDDGTNEASYAAEEGTVERVLF
jgi:hypothetical protein